MAKSFFEKLASSLKMEIGEENKATQYSEQTPATTAAEEENEDAIMPLGEMPDSKMESDEEADTEPETVPYPNEEEGEEKEKMMGDDEEEGEKEGEVVEEGGPEGSYTIAPQSPKKYETQLAAAHTKTTRHHITRKHITLPSIKEMDEDMMDEDMEGQLAIDVYQTEEDIVIKSTIAGVDPEDLDINIAGDTVTIRGERKKDDEISNDNYYYQECYWGSFSRSIVLPVEVDGDRAEAGFQNGILTIRLPKIAKNKLKKIRVTKR